jgi:hypothetical protein
MKKIKLLPLLGLAISSSNLGADVLELKNGQVLNGKYAGGTGETLKYETAEGMQVIQTAQVVALTFTSSNAAPAAPAPTGRPAVPAAQAQTITLPAGTTLMVRIMDGISSKNAPGTTFATKLESDVSANGMVAIKSGTPIYGQVHSASQARRVAGQSTLDIRLTKVVIDGRSVQLSTTPYQEAGERSVRKEARGAAAGAAIGAIAGSPGVGAAAGVAAGALKKGDTVTITPGTLLQFTLTQPLTIPAAQG